MRAGLSSWVGSAELGEVPGCSGSGSGRVQVAWRVVGEGGVLGCCTGGDGGNLFDRG